MSEKNYIYDKDEITELLKKIQVNPVLCKDCNNAICYDNTRCTILSRGKDKGKLSFRGTYYLTSKTIEGKQYYIKICKECLIKKLPDFKNVKNESRIFNTFNKYVSVAFGIPMNKINKKNKESALTLENMILKYGKKIGTEKWNEYRRLQALSNKFEYKQKKHGWTKTQFEEFNLSRAATLENMIERHGKELGTKKFKNYVDLQKLTKSKEYVVNKYGLKYWENLCKSKGITLHNMQRKYGKELGLIKYKEWYTTIEENSNLMFSTKYSKTSINCFNELLKYDDIFNNYEVFYKGKTKEYYKYSNITNSIYFLDFYIPELKLCIEFYGDYWHMNPSQYKSTDINESTKLTAKEKWQSDEVRINALNKEFNIETIIIWESDYNRNKKEIFNKIIDKVKYLHGKRNINKL